MTDTDSRTAPQPRTPSSANAPWLVRATTPMTNRFMRIGLPTGPNVLLPVRGRTSGLPRTAPVAVVEIDGRRYVIGAYGDVQWVRNLRAAGEASIRLGRRDIDVNARELGQDEALTFFTERLPGYIRRLPAFGRVFARVLFMNFNNILIGSDNAEALVEYYTQLFGPPGFNEGGYAGWQFGDGFVSIGAHSEVHGRNAQPGRFIWNLETPDVRGEFEKLKTAGAIVVKEPYEMEGFAGFAIATLADPDGNYFQLTAPYESAGTGGGSEE